MFWAVDRRARQSDMDRCDCGFHAVEAKTRREAITKINRFGRKMQKEDVNWGPCNPRCCLNGPFSSLEEVMADYLARHPDETAKKLKRFGWMDKYTRRFLS